MRLTKEDPGTRAAGRSGLWQRPRLNPALTVVAGVLLLTVVMSFAAVSIAMRYSDPRLPEQYHWEGWQVDRDFELSRRASELGVRAIVDAPIIATTPPASGASTAVRAASEAEAPSLCRVRLSIAGAAPSALTLDIVHPSRPELDQHLRLRRTAASIYESPCKPAPSALWRLELADASRTWSVRERSTGSLARVSIAAREVVQE